MNKIDINTKINVGSDDVIMNGEELSFQKKNTLAYKQLLSNYTVRNNSGWPTTTGKNIQVTSTSNKNLMLLTENNKNFYYLTDNISYTNSNFIDNDTSTVYDANTLYDMSSAVTIGDKTYSINNERLLTINEQLSMPVKGTIKSCAFINNSYCYIIKSSESIYKCVYYNGDWTTTKLATAQDAYYTKNYPVLLYTDNVNTYQENGTKILDFPTNNGYYVNSSEWVLGYENDNHYLCRAYSYIGGTLTTHLYHGLVSYNGVVYGEPYPVNASNEPLTFEYLTNGVMKWTIDSTATSTISVAEPTETLSTDTTVSSNKVTIDGTVVYNWCYGWNPLTNTFLTISGSDGTSKDLFAYSGGNYVTGAVKRTVIGTNVSLGSLNGTATTYENLYPLKYAFTNVISDKGKTYDYGDNWYKIKYTSFYFGTAKCASSTYPVLLESPAMYIQNGNTYYLDAIGSAITDYSTPPTDTWTFGISLPSSSSTDTKNIANETLFIADNGSYYRHHIITASEINDNSWLDFIHTLDFDVSTISFYTTQGLYNLHYYNDNLIGSSYNYTEISPVSTEWSGIYYINDGTLMMDNFIYKLEYSLDIKVKKIADYLFTTNIASPNTVFSENKEGEIELIRGYIPYSNEMNLSNSWQNMKMSLASDGSAYNDVWFEGAGVNVTLDDKFPSSSTLLPAMQINMYLNTDNLSEFNRNVIDGGKPLFEPETSLLYSEDELQVYYTHTQATTDITYKYSILNGEKSANSKYTDATWYATASLIILSVGLGSLYNNINYISSTLVLPGYYSARMYTSNNTAYLVYNAATQVYRSTSVFTIYSSSYYYDGQAIYYTGNLNNTTSNEFVCYALGMKFLANSGTEAYFYSNFDKSIYTFTGSNTLTKTTSIAMFGEPIDSLFSSCNQSLYLLNSDGNVFILTGESSCVIENTGATSLQGTTIGCACCNIDSTSWSLYKPYIDTDETAELLPVDLRTNWIGDDTKMFTFSFADIVLFNSNPTKDTNLKFYIICQNGISSEPYEKVITVKPSDWKGNNYRIRTNPPNETGTAFKMGIYSESEIHLQSIMVDFKVSSTQNNTAKGWK